MIDWTLEKYKAAMNIKKNQQNEELVIDNNIEKLDKKGISAINKKNKALLKYEVSIYRKILFSIFNFIILFFIFFIRNII